MDTVYCALASEIIHHLKQKIDGYKAEQKEGQGRSDSGTGDIPTGRATLYRPEPFGRTVQCPSCSAGSATTELGGCTG